MVTVSNLSKHFVRRKQGFFSIPGIIRAVDGISFHIVEGTTLGLVGESGSGKTTAARSLLRLVEPDSGTITINGYDVGSLDKKELQQFRRNVQLVFQDPYDSLNPRMTVGRIVSEPLRIHGVGSKRSIEEKTAELFEQVGLRPDMSNRYPHEFSGGQRQRIGIARALALKPKFLVLDEPVSALDVSIQGQILNLMKDLQKKLGLTYLFVAHDLAVVEYMSDMIAVMYLGKIVEYGPGPVLCSEPLHPYTKSLIDSLPDISKGKGNFKSLPGEMPSPENPPQGCHFAPRCPRVIARCREEYPELKELGERKVACHLY